MSYCLNPRCLKPQNLKRQNFCLNCQTPLLLKNRYRAIKIIGQGGMGRTFLAIDQKSQHPDSRCVIKQFFPQTGNLNNSQKMRELFDVEIFSLKKLGQHPQIPQLYDNFAQNEYQYLVQEWIEGDNLIQLMERECIVRQKGNS